MSNGKLHSNSQFKSDVNKHAIHGADAFEPTSSPYLQRTMASVHCRERQEIFMPIVQAVHKSDARLRR
jgi:hypothetical protein